MREIGRIVLLQVQRSSMKQGQDPNFWYDTRALASVPEVEVTPEGVIGFTESCDAIVDVHNRFHPQTKRRPENAFSMGFTSHYTRMRERFGAHMTDGIAGENFLVQTEREQTIDDVKAGVVIENHEGKRVELVRIEIAEPCLKFSRFALQMTPEAPGGKHVTEALQFLRKGLRGFYACYDGLPVRVKTGARVFGLL